MTNDEFRMEPNTLDCRLILVIRQQQRQLLIKGIIIDGSFIVDFHSSFVIRNL